MGTYVDMDLIEVTISADKVGAALAAVNKLSVKRGVGPFSNLVKALGEWAFESEVKQDGSLEITEFICDKLGDEVELLKALAPYIDPSAEILCEDGSGEHWKWIFKKGKLKQLDGYIKYK